MILPIILGLLALGGFLVLTKKEAVPETPELPPVVEVPYTVEDLVQEIKRAPSLVELNYYYNLIGELFVNNEINYVDYMALYAAYEARWYELTGGAE